MKFSFFKSALIFFYCLLFVLSPVAVSAQVVFDNYAALQRESLFGRDKAETTLSASLLAAALGGLMETFSYYTRQIALDTAKYVAYGGKGQGALAFRDGFNAYLTNVTKDALASGIGELGKPFGLNLCQVPDPRVNVYLQIGLRAIYGQGSPTPNCRWQDLTKGGIFDPNAWNDRYGSTDKLADTFSGSLSVENTDFGVALGAMAQLDRIQAQKREEAIAERLEGDGFRSLTSLISGDILTPGQVVKKETEKLTATHQGEISSEQIAGIYGSGAAQIIPSAASVFLNTLTSQLLQRVITEGLFPDRGKTADEEGVINPFAQGILSNRRAAEVAFNELLTGLPVKQLTDYNIVQQFAACPENPGMNNCVIDSGFQRILSQAEAGQPLTIAQAIDKGWLNPNWPLISTRAETAHSDIRGCQVGKYCYSNIQKLRKVRILPLGFEIAALRSDPDNPWKLGDVVRNFESCHRDPATGLIIPDPAFPFCHLINPNWVVRAPAVRCETQVFGSQLVSPSSGDRRQECVDISTCLQEGPNGECIGGLYGYCTKEKNVWRLPGESCPAYFNTCTTYTNNKSGQVTSYLQKTLDFGDCNVDNVGCRAYSLEQAGQEWSAATVIDVNNPLVLAAKRAGRNQAIYFDEAVQAESNICRADNLGCSAFYAGERDQSGEYVQNDDEIFVKSDKLTYFQKAPDYLGCYDTNRAANSPEINWPTTIQEARNGVAQDARCDAFASVCVSEEVGCEGFTPAGSTTVIPGKIGTQNACPAECVGYDSFKEEATAFTRDRFPVHFIPESADSCSVDYVGCSEFTNLDEVGRGGEGLEYYTDLKYCERPAENDSNIETYYSWEGSVDEGFVIRIHKLLPLRGDRAEYISDLRQVGAISEEVAAEFAFDSPAYNDDSVEALNDQFARCNQANYELRVNTPYSPDKAEPDCRALFNREGKVSYRLLSETITVSDSCHPLRKTEPVFFVDQNLRNEDACTRKGGNFDNGSCQRCTNGGVFEGGACVYYTISLPGEAESCPATANNCRAYVGNAGRNIEYVVEDDFEPNGDNPDALVAALSGWFTDDLINRQNQVRISGEATHVGLHSLEVLPNVTTVYRTVPTSTLEDSKVFELSFWARGLGQSLAIEFVQNEESVGNFTFDPTTGAFQPVSIGNNWQRYTFGPVQFTGSAENDLVLRFRNVDGANVGAYFIDHVELTRVTENLTLIRDSWQTTEGYDVSLSCDSNPTDGLPGEMLGCSAYTDSFGNDRFATGFEQLCRPKALGCQPVWDTFNTVSSDTSAQAEAHNVWCADNQRETCRVVVAGQELGSCVVQQGQTGCFIAKVVLPVGQQLPAEFVVPSTVLIPADTAVNAPIYLAVREEFQCLQSERGCMSLGLEEQVVPDRNNPDAYDHVDTLVKNDPEIYDRILCRDDLIGCGEFKAGQTVQYFKDPVVTGNSVCEYRPKSNNALEQEYGWFKPANIGTCNTDSDILCTEDSACPEFNLFGVVRPGRCENIGNVACYPDHRRPGSFYDIWSNGNAEYEGFVGACGEEYNACTELVDVGDTSQLYPEGTPYYAIFDQGMQQKVGECAGQVSLTEGCVLFDRTDNPNKAYNSAATYAESERTNPKYGVVNPVTSGNLDTNLILKVDRDRACSEWLACRSSVPQIVETNDGLKKVDLCYEYKACNEFDPSLGCTNFVSNSEPNAAGFVESKSRLTYENYISRDTSWYDDEYVGYSLFDKYQINNLLYFFITPSKYQALQDDQGAVKLEFSDIESFIAYGQPGFDLANNPGLSCEGKQEWAPCGAVQDGINQGRCYNNRCIYPVDGTFPNTVTNSSTVNIALSKLELNSCKGYPEINSPFPSETGGTPTDNLGDRVEYKDRPALFNNANICQNNECACSYEKVIYQNNVTDYWSTRVKDQSPPSGVCFGGLEGKSCSVDSDCNRVEGVGDNQRVVAEGKCSFQKKTENHIGLEGYCLEYDLSRPINNIPGAYACLTWLPIEVSASGVDIYNTKEEAGYLPRLDARVSDNFFGGEVYCAVGTDVKSGVQYMRSADVYAPDADVETDDFLYSLGLSEIQSIEDLTVPPAGQNISFYSQFFKDSNNYPQTRQCAMSSIAQASPSESAFCGAGHNALVNAMMVWSWKNIDLNTAILRVENPPEHANDDGAAYFGEYYGVHPNRQDDNAYRALGPRLNDCGTNGSPACTVFHFAPVPPNNPEGRHYGDEWDLGTIMHPPRFWGDRTFADIMGNRDSYQAFNYRQTSGATNRVISSIPMLPGAAHMPFNNGINESFKGSFLTEYGNGYSFEENLNEYSLDKVYFVPTGFPYGIDSQMPALFSADVFINFTDLRNKLSESRNAGLNGERVLVSGGGPISLSTSRGDGDGRDDFFGKEGGVIPSGQSNGRMWHYLLERDYGAGLLSYGNYADLRAQGSLLGVMDNQPDLQERNEVFHRYVTVAFMSGAGNHPFTFDADSPPTSWEAGVVNDPFAVVCGNNQLPWVAIGMDFNRNGEFLGYVSRWCKGNDAIQFAVVAALHDQCAEFAQVYQNTGDVLSESTNRAWTNRVWNGAVNVTNGNGGRLHPSVDELFRDRNLPPFGSTYLSGEDIRLNDRAKSKMKQFVFSRPDLDGIPFSCSVRNGFAAVANGPRIAMFKEFSVNNRYCPFSYRDGRLYSQILPGKNFEQGYVAIDQLFATVYRVAKFEYNGLLGDYRILGGNDPVRDKTGPVNFINDGLTTPQVYSLHPNCFNLAEGTSCSAGEQHNITVNGLNGTLTDYDDDGFADEDRDNDRAPDAIINVGSQPVVASFFAFADDNRMPIRRILVKWGDVSQITNDGRFGYYPNAKPFCENDSSGGLADRVSQCVYINDEDTPTGLTCLDGSDGQCPQDMRCLQTRELIQKARNGDVPADYATKRFGNSARACTSDYYTFNHNYTCGAEDQNDPTIFREVSTLETGTRNRLLAQQLSMNDRVCVYKPGVQVLDNWGYCNASDINPDGTITGRTTGFYGGLCNRTGDSRYWTYFQGDIIVIPENL